MENQHETIVGPTKPALEIHLPETVVDNPTVPMRWCFSREMHTKITEGLKRGFGYGMLLVAQLEGDTSGYREVRDVKSPLDMFTFIRFPRPGKWSVGLFLFSRTWLVEGKNMNSALMRSLSTHYLQRIESGELYNMKLCDLAEIDPSQAGGSLFGYDHSYHITSRVISVEVPKEIFASEPHQSVRAFANYFFRKRMEDECFLRRRLLVMTIGFGFIPYLVIECTKRLGLLFFGILFSTFLLKGSDGVVMSALKSGVNVSFASGINELEEIEGKIVSHLKGRLFFLTPGMLLIVAFLGWLLFKMVSMVLSLSFVVLTGRLVVVGQHRVSDIIVGLTLVAAVLWFSKKKIKKWIKNWHETPAYIEQQRIKEQLKEEKIRARSVEFGRKQAEIAERRANALVCGDAPATVSLTAIPPEAQTFGLRFAAFKRGKCRPYGD